MNTINWRHNSNMHFAYFNKRCVAALLECNDKHSVKLVINGETQKTFGDIAIAKNFVERSYTTALNQEGQYEF